jgi:phage tail sheath protein FI
VIARPARAPGLAFEAVRPPPAISPLRTDIAAFVGATRRGPIGVPIRVEGWRGYQRELGGLDAALELPYAVRAYFDNGGEVAWIVRVAGPGAAAAGALWDAAGLGDLPASRLGIRAATAGGWSEGARVSIAYRGRTATGRPMVDVRIRAQGGELEELRAIPADELIERVALQSRMIRIAPLAAPARTGAGGAASRAFAEATLVLAGAREAAPAGADYLAALDLLDELPEVALIALPDLHAFAGDEAPRIYAEAAARAEALRDRLVLVDLPPPAPGERWHADLVATWIERMLGRYTSDLDGTTPMWRAAALYHPRVRVRDPLGGDARPDRVISPVGHVAGTISLLDRNRGAHATPANARLAGLLDLGEEYDDAEHAALNEAGVDLLRCVPSLGFSVWGGRTLDRTREHRFVAHRRLVHRLVRAIRRVAEPLVFEVNAPVLWFAFVRAITSVLLAAWRAGALAGGRPEEAFEVVCDDTTNPPEEIDAGRCVCAISVAPAVPMEFILIRVALSRDGALEVLS